MSVHETLDIAGRLTLRLHTPDGRVVDERTAHNDITFRGRDLVARLFNFKLEAAVPRVSRMGVGTGGRPFDPKDNALASRVDPWIPISNVEEGIHTEPSGRERRRLRITGELGENECNAELREAGLFTGRDGDLVMYNRVVFPPINKTSEFQLTLVWDIIF
jgi:hypothetical protein